MYCIQNTFSSVDEGYWVTRGICKRKSGLTGVLGTMKPAAALSVSRFHRFKAGYRCRISAQQRLGHHLGHVPHPDIISFDVFESVLEHGHTIRAGDTDSIGTLLQRLVDASPVDPLPGMFLHPHPAAAGAAAEGGVPLALHFGGSLTGGRLDDGARCIVNVVMPSQIAGVMENCCAHFPCCLIQDKFSVLNQLLQQLAVVDDLQLKAVLPVIIFKGREAVRALSDDLCDAVLDEGRDIFPGHLVEDVLIPQPAHAVAAAFFVPPEGSP